MSTYTYKCNNEKCEIHDILLEVTQSMKDPKLTTCPECEETTLERVVTPSGGFRIGGLGVHKPTAHWGD
mgnify:CR=1 FL=1